MWTVIVDTQEGLKIFKGVTVNTSDAGLVLHRENSDPTTIETGLIRSVAAYPQERIFLEARLLDLQLRPV